MKEVADAPPSPITDHCLLINNVDTGPVMFRVILFPVNTIEILERRFDPPPSLSYMALLRYICNAMDNQRIIQSTASRFFHLSPEPGML
jgi:hypothetical protein